MIEYPKLQIAIEYLEAAIEERELHQRYFAAMNLAGVAEEILGKVIRTNGGVDQLTETVNLLSTIQDGAWELLGWEQLDKKRLKKLLGSTKNSIKHMDNASEANAELFFMVEDESKWLIQAAIRNLDILNIYYSNTVKEFVEKYATAEEKP